MRVFDFVMTLYSFVYALGVAHILDAVGDIIRAGRRVRLSWLHAAWMLNAILLIVSWWLALWDLRGQSYWPMSTVLVFFAMACVIYLEARLVSPAIPHEGPFDLREFHREEVRKYAGLYSAILVLTILIVYAYGDATQNWEAENNSNWPALAASAGATVSTNRWIQALGVIVNMGVWVWYFGKLQGALVDLP